MWKELVDIFRGVEPLQGVADGFVEMLGLTLRMAETVRPHVHDRKLDDSTWKELLALDEQVNQHEWTIRRALVSHIALQKTELPYCMKVMSLVKDAERLGEYVKNVAAVVRHPQGAVLDGPIQDATEDLVATAMKVFRQAGKAVVAQDTDAANTLIDQSKSVLQRSDELMRSVATSDLNAAQASSTALVAFFYRRLVSHLINVVSSVVLPVHELDSHDERYAPA